MAEAEMEVDMSHQASLQVPFDEDLINYESDAADHVDAPPDEQDGNHYVDALLGDVIAVKNTDATEDQNGTLGHADGTESRHETDVVEPTAATEASDAVLHTDDIDFSAGGEPANTAEAEELPQPADEIDYSLDDINVPDGTVENNEENDGGEAVSSPVMPLAETANIDEAENPEISWEQDDETANAETGLAGEESKDAGEEQHEMFAEEPKDVFGADSGREDADEDVDNDAEETSEAEAAEAEAAEAAEEASNVDEGAHEARGETNIVEDDEPTQGSNAAAADSHFPSISVQYQGDEFPFFSSSSDGFFSDESILNDNMQSLLQSFRSQLASDVAAEDELVFQVDELGLEFSESSTSNLTMHQILEIFDLLVKNDDPDGSRTLYTYLFVRPHVARRYEFLVECATSGKGLDEVNYIFPQQVSHKSSIVEDRGSLVVGGVGLFQEGLPEFAHDNGEQADGTQDDHYDYQGQNNDEEYDLSAEFDEAIENTEDVRMNENRDHEQETSATSTLQGDGDTADLSVDADTETAVDNDAEDHLYMADTGEYAEIDWRDETEAGDDSVGETELSASKRPRDNDELEVEDEKDVKRRRP